MALVGPAQDFLQVIQIVVTEHAHLRARKPRGINDAGVDQLVHDDDIVAVKQSADDAGGGGVAGGKGERGRSAFERGQRFLQNVMRRQRAAEQAGSARARAKFVDSVHGGFLQSRIIGQTEVIVGGKIEERLPVHLDARALGRINAAQFAVKPLLADILQS
jgi:hypothetical protein